MCGWLEAHREYLGQMDLNIRSPLVWQFYDDTLKTLAGYGARIVRLDAFAYAPKAVGEKNFLNEPGTWDLLAKVDSKVNFVYTGRSPAVWSPATMCMRKACPASCGFPSGPTP